MSASAVRGGQVYVEIGANPSKLLAALSTINTKIADVGMTLETAGAGMAAIGAAIAGPILAVGGAFVAQTAEMENMRAALKDIGTAVGEAVDVSRLFHRESRAPERMVQPGATQFVYVHADAQLADRYFFQHWAGHTWPAIS